jgi:hypothetical protein
MVNRRDKQRGVVGVAAGPAADIFMSLEMLKQLNEHPYLGRSSIPQPHSQAQIKFGAFGVAVFANCGEGFIFVFPRLGLGRVIPVVDVQFFCGIATFQTRKFVAFQNL